MSTRPVVAVLTVAFLAAIVLGCSPAQAPLTAQEIVAAFAAENQDVARTFHMECQGTTGISSIGPDAPGVPGAQEFTASINASFDFSGDDFAGTLTTRPGPIAGMPEQAPSTTGYARVGGVLFVRHPESGWQTTDGLGLPQPSFDPLQGLTAADVAYEAPETVGELALNRLRILDPVAAVARTMFGNAVGAKDLKSDSAEFLLYVDGQGVPVRARLSFDGQVSLVVPGDVIASGTGYRFAFDYQFSAWGEDLVIRSPL